MIGEASGALDRIALVVEILDLVFGRDRRRLPFGEPEAARLRKIAERKQLQRMAVGADLAVDLEAALQLRLVVFSEWTGERPGLPRRRNLLGKLRGGRRRHGNGKGGEDESEDGRAANS